MYFCGVKNVHVALTVAVLVYICSSTRACFIRNCPPGGKRSMAILDHEQAPCLSCGPDNSGQCIGPSTCCGDFGCYIGTPESSVCAKENDSTKPCLVSGERCGAHGQGYCVSDGICCDSTACSLNQKCEREHGGNSVQLLSLLNRILQTRDLE